MRLNLVIHSGTIFFPFKNSKNQVSKKIKLIKIAPYPNTTTIPSTGGRAIKDPSETPFVFRLISTSLSIAAAMQQILHRKTSLLKIRISIKSTKMNAFEENIKSAL